MTSQLNEEEKAAIRKCHYRLRMWGSVTYVDNKQTDENDTVFWFEYASGASNIGLIHTRAMIEVYKRHANDNHPKQVLINMKQAPPGAINIKPMSTKSEQGAEDIPPIPINE
jgi:hypothetical protein